MAKFYVQCGPIEVVLSAESERCAAMAAIDRLLDSHLWIYDDEGLTDQDRRDHLMIEALLHLEPAVRVSQRGFDRDDAASIGTPELVAQWHELMTGMARLFATAGLLPRSLSIGPLSNGPLSIGGQTDSVADLLQRSPVRRPR